MVHIHKPQRGFAHPLLVFVIFAVLAAIGVVGWRVQAFAKHTQAQAVLSQEEVLSTPRGGAPVIYGVPVSTDITDMSGRIPKIDEEIIPKDLDASDTLHRFFSTLRDRDYFASLYYVSEDLWQSVSDQSHTSDPYKIIELCRLDQKCGVLIATHTLSSPFQQSQYINKDGVKGVTMSFDLAVANPSAAKNYPKGTTIDFSLIPYTQDDNGYWAIDRIALDSFALN